MGALADLGDAEVPALAGDGQKLVYWWHEVADDDDRALLRRWVETPRGQVGHKTYRGIAEALRATGYSIATDTVSAGVRLLKGTVWAS